MTCNICGKKITYIGKHLLYSHKNVSKKDYYDEFLKKPGEGECKICGKETKFISISHGYRKTCSSECSKKLSSLTMKNTCLKKYGVDNPAKCKEIKEKIKKTNKKKYCGNSPNCSKEVKEKQKRTNLKKYGVEVPIQNKEIKEKIKNTCIKKYGVDNPWKNNIGKEMNILSCRFKVRNTIKQKVLSKIKKLEKKYNFKFINFIEDKTDFVFFNIYCNKCKQKTIGTTNSVYLRVTPEKEFRCLSCIPYKSKSSKYETEIYKFLKNKLKIKNIIRNSKQIIYPYELDLFLPDFNLAIEFNGIYWHSTKYCDKDYHLRKTELCEKKKIHLIHIFEHEWINENDRIKNYIENLILYNKEDKNFKPGDRRYHSVLNLQEKYEIIEPFKENFLNFEFWNCGEIDNSNKNNILNLGGK